MPTITSTDPAFIPAAKRATDILWALALEAPTYAGDNDRDSELRFRLQDLATQAMSVSMHGAELVGDRTPDQRPDLSQLLPQLPHVVDELIEHTSALDDFEILRFLGRVSDMYREVKSLGLLP